MQRTLLKSKIHRATVTDANVGYEGSVTIDEGLMDAARIMEYEMVPIWDVTNGVRIETYAIRGKRASGVVCINGAAAHHVKKGDKVIIATYGIYSDAEIASFEPIKLFVDDSNKVIAK